MHRSNPELAGLRLAVRLALLDAVPRTGPVAGRCAALEAARNRLAGLLAQEGTVDLLPDTLSDIRDRALFAAALQGAFEEAWAVVTG